MKTHAINHTGRSDWRYSTAHESSKPGYLAAKFAKLRREQEAAKQEREAVVAKRKIKGA